MRTMLFVLVLSLSWVAVSAAGLSIDGQGIYDEEEGDRIIIFPATETDVATPSPVFGKGG